jgi:uncharacterized protein YjiK
MRQKSHLIKRGRNFYIPLTIFLIFIFRCQLSIVVHAAGLTEPKMHVKKTILLSEVTLPFAEPSGVAWSDDLESMWVVSGGDQHIYRLDANGTVTQRLPFIGTDLEGIAFDETDSTLLVVDEALKEIFHLDLNGSLLMQKKLSYDTKKKNKGPEGITIGSEHRIYIVNERKPSVLLQLDSHYMIQQTTPLTFALDYSDITYDKSSDTFFILSDESRAFFAWTRRQGVICTYKLPNDKNEGIAFDRKRNIFYIVNDNTSKLYFFKSN